MLKYTIDCFHIGSPRVRPSGFPQFPSLTIGAWAEKYFGLLQSFVLWMKAERDQKPDVSGCKWETGQEPSLKPSGIFRMCGYSPSGGRLEVATTTTPFRNRFSKSCFRIMASAMSVTWKVRYEYILLWVKHKGKYSRTLLNVSVLSKLPETHQSTGDTLPRWSPLQLEQWGHRIWPFYLLSSLACSVSVDGSLKKKRAKTCLDSVGSVWV